MKFLKISLYIDIFASQNYLQDAQLYRVVVQIQGKNEK